MYKTVLGNKLYYVKNDFFNGVLVVGVVHGDEPQGKFLIEEYLKINKDISKLAFIPVLNPDGFYLNQRVNSKGVDINRNFPTNNWELTEKNEFFGGVSPASEIETRFLINTIESLKPRLVLTLHAPFKVVNYDGDAKEISHKISNIISTNNISANRCLLGLPSLFWSFISF